MKVAIPTDDEIHVAPRFLRVKKFLIAEVGVDIGYRIVEVRPNNPPRTARPIRLRPEIRMSRYRDIARLLSDCRAVIAGSMGDTMRQAMERSGIEVIITFEELAERALALMAVGLLADESRVDPADAELDPEDDDFPELNDEFDG